MSEEHETFIKTPKQLIVAIVLAFVVPVVLIALLVKYVGQSERTGAGANAMTEQAVTDRIRPVSTYELVGAAGPAKVHSGEQVYASQCAACHTAGVAGAPKLGDAMQWGPRIAGGLGGLIGSALKGKGAMAAQSGGKYSDLEIAKAVVHMANNSGADFEEPTAESLKGAATAPAAAQPAQKKSNVSAPATIAKAAGAAAAKPPAAAKPAAAESVATPSIVNRARQAGTSVAKEAQRAVASPAAKQSVDTSVSAATAAARAAAAASAAAVVSKSVASEPATPTTVDKLVFADANEVKAATGAGIPNRLSIFFDSGSSDVSTQAADDLWKLIYFTKNGDWSRIGLSGYTDGTGDTETNERLSRKRMSNVREVLIDIGVAEDRIVMVKPERVEAASGASKNARRVDVYHSK